MGPLQPQSYSTGQGGLTTTASMLQPQPTTSPQVFFPRELSNLVDINLAE